MAKLSNLHNLRKWLYVPDVAKRLTMLSEGEISEADVLQFALDGQLTLSVIFPNYATAKRAYLVPLKDAVPVTRNMFGKERTFIEGDYIGDGNLLRVSEEVVTLHDDAYDLTMYGNEKFDIQYKSHSLTDGPEVKLGGFEGTFVSKDGEIFALQEHYSDNEYFVNSGKSKLKEPLCHPDNYYPAGGLPVDSRLVVRTDTLAEFERKHGAESEQIKKPSSESEEPTKRRTQLNVIGGLMALMLGKSPKGIAQSVYENQGTIVAALLAHYEHVKGMGQRNIEQIMADANKSLKDSTPLGE